jgi:hypothetical protein
MLMVSHQSRQSHHHPVTPRLPLLLQHPLPLEVVSMVLTPTSWMPYLQTFGLRSSHPCRVDFVFSGRMMMTTITLFRSRRRRP